MIMTTIAQSCELHARIGWQGLTKKEYLDDGDYYLVTGVDFDNGHIAFDRCHFVTRDRYDQDQHIQLKVDDVLVTKDGTIGKVAIIDKPIDKPATLNNGVFVVRPKNTKNLLPRYLMLALSSGHFNRFIERIKVGCTIAHLNQEKFLDFEFPLPTIKEQEHAIQVFDAANSLLAKRRQQLQKLDDLIKSRFVEMFGDPIDNKRKWPTKALENICKTIVDCPHSTPQYTSVDTGYMCIRTSIVKKNRIAWDEIEYISEAEYWQRVQRKRPEKGDVVYTREGGILGIAAIIDKDCNVALGQRSMLLSPDKQFCTPEFLSVAMNFDTFLDKALKSMSGSASPHINVGDIKAFQMILPPIKQQQAFSSFMVQLDKSKATIKKSLIEAHTLYDSLMQKYFWRD